MKKSKQVQSATYPLYAFLLLVIPLICFGLYKDRYWLRLVGPRFHAGDCVVKVYPHEFGNYYSYQHIVTVGKREYLTQDYYFYKGTPYRLGDNPSGIVTWIIDEEYNKVQCPDKIEE